MSGTTSTTAAQNFIHKSVKLTLSTHVNANNQKKKKRNMANDLLFLGKQHVLYKTVFTIITVYKNKAVMCKLMHLQTHDYNHNPKSKEPIVKIIQVG